MRRVFFTHSTTQRRRLGLGVWLMAVLLNVSLTSIGFELLGTIAGGMLSGLAAVMCMCSFPSDTP